MLIAIAAMGVLLGLTITAVIMLLWWIKDIEDHYVPAKIINEKFKLLDITFHYLEDLVKESDLILAKSIDELRNEMKEKENK